VTVLRPNGQSEKQASLNIGMKIGKKIHAPKAYKINSSQPPRKNQIILPKSAIIILCKKFD
jgi:hypothetical protein